MSHQSDRVGVDEAEREFFELLERVEGGAEITITREGVPVAKLIPFKQKSTPAERREAIEAMRKSSAALSLSGLKIRDMIDEGRK